jgi:hypothetical protein
MIPAILGALPLAVAVCDAGSEPATLTLPLVADGAGLGAFTSDEGYQIELSELRVALRDIELTIEGETHASLMRGLRRSLLPLAQAHPGHYAGGDVTGELLGNFLIDAFSGGDRELGQATMLEGDYHGMNFTFRRADADDGLDAEDTLLGHTFALSGVARRDDLEVAFDAVLDIDDDTQMVGAPFTFEARPGAEPTLVLRILMVDPSTEADTVFDGVDFFALGDGDELSIRPGDDAHNILRRRIQVHDHWWLEPRD